MGTGVTAEQSSASRYGWICCQSAFEHLSKVPSDLLNREHVMEPGNAQLSMTVLMTPDMANFSGNVHGGTC